MALYVPTRSQLLLHILCIVERRDLVFALKTHKTIIFHEFAPNLVTVHFPTQGPVVWNNLPVDIHAEPDITRFENILKAFFFRLALNLQ